MFDQLKITEREIITLTGINKNKDYIDQGDSEDEDGKSMISKSDLPSAYYEDGSPKSPYLS